MDTAKLPKKYPGPKLFSKLATYKTIQGITIDELCKRLGWHYQQYYSLNNARRTVRRETLAHVIEALELQPEKFFDDSKTNDAGTIAAIFRQYPLDVLQWLVTERGREAMLKQYGLDHFSHAKEQLVSVVEQVYGAGVEEKIM